VSRSARSRSFCVARSARFAQFRGAADRRAGVRRPVGPRPASVIGRVWSRLTIRPPERSVEFLRSQRGSAARRRQMVRYSSGHLVLRPAAARRAHPRLARRDGEMERAVDFNRTRRMQCANATAHGRSIWLGSNAGTKAAKRVRATAPHAKPRTPCAGHHLRRRPCVGRRQRKTARPIPHLYLRRLAGEHRLRSRSQPRSTDGSLEELVVPGSVRPGVRVGVGGGDQSVVGALKQDSCGLLVVSAW